jgi:hypothetical protein
MTLLTLGRSARLLGFKLILIAILVLPGGVAVQAADHRDSPLMGQDPAADINDVFVFVNPNDPTKVVFAFIGTSHPLPGEPGTVGFPPQQ